MPEGEQQGFEVDPKDVITSLKEQNSALAEAVAMRDALIKKMQRDSQAQIEEIAGELQRLKEEASGN